MNIHFKNLKCRVGIHYPVPSNKCGFIDVVSGLHVNYYTCENCNKEWMAESKYNTFKVYI